MTIYRTKESSRRVSNSIRDSVNDSCSCTQVFLAKYTDQNHATPATTPRTSPSKLLASLFVPAPCKSRSEPLPAVEEGALLLLLVILVVLVDPTEVDEGIWVAIGTIVDDDAELTDGIVDLGKPMIEMFEVTEEVVLVELGVSPETVTGLPYSVVLAPITSGTARVWVFPALSVKAASPVVVVVPSGVSELGDGRLRLPMAEDGIGVSLALHAACRSAMSWLGSRSSLKHLLLIHEETSDRKVPGPAKLHIPGSDC